jgi:hypothetical protein
MRLLLQSYIWLHIQIVSGWRTDLPTISNDSASFPGSRSLNGGKDYQTDSLSDIENAAP